MSPTSIVPKQLADVSPRVTFVSWVYRRFLALWSRISISRLGKYSLARVQTLDNYCEQTSLLRVISVVILMPFPASLLELACELVPLRDPKEGWKANTGAWIRLCVLITSTAAGSLFQVRATIPILSLFKICGVSVATGVGSTLAVLLLASLWSFPLPFCLMLMCIPAVIIFVALLLMTIRKGGKFIGTTEKSLKLKVYLILAQVQLSVVYLTFGVIFERYTHSLLQRFGLLLFVPVMKLAMKHYIARLADNMESIPAVVVFSVDVFNSLYSSICIQTSSSWWVLLIIVALNGFHTTISMLEINRATTAVLALNWKFDSNLQSNQRRVAVAPIRSNRAPSRRGIEIFKSFSKLPLSKAPGTSNHGEISSKLLFRLEYRVLVGYIEAVIPLLYVLHLTIVSRLPSGKFYSHIRSLTDEQLQATVRNILVYALTEIGCLVWLHVEIKRKLGFSLLYQLAFVLETETELLQGRLFVWIVILLQLTLAHYGMDFSFDFAWMDSKTTE